MSPGQTDRTQHTNTMEDRSIDYSELYRSEELKQLKKRLKRNQLVLQICSVTLVVGGLVFWIIPRSNFSSLNLLLYCILAFVILVLSLFSQRRPYFSVLASLVLCIGFWVLEIIFLDIDEILIETSIQKLVILSLLITRLHSSKEAELIRKELHFS
jgi:hypothetical protein